LQILESLKWVSVSGHAEGCDQNIRGTGYAVIAVVQVGLLLKFETLCRRLE
jgi:hypothetical protein